MTTKLDELEEVGSSFPDHRDRWNRFGRMHGMIPGQDLAWMVSHNASGDNGDLDVYVIGNIEASASSWSTTLSNIALTDDVGGPWAMSCAWVEETDDLVVAYTEDDTHVKIAVLPLAGSSFSLGSEEDAFTLPAGYTAGLVSVDVDQDTESMVVACLCDKGAGRAAVVWAIRDNLGVWSSGPYEFEVDSYDANQLLDSPNVTGGPFAVVVGNDTFDNGTWTNTVWAHFLVRAADYGKTEFWQVAYDADDADNAEAAEQISDNLVPSTVNVQHASGTLFNTGEVAQPDRVMVGVSTRQGTTLGEYEADNDWLVSMTSQSLLLPHSWPSTTNPYLQGSGSSKSSRPETDNIKYMSLVGGPDRICFQYIRHTPYGNGSSSYHPVYFVHGKLDRDNQAVEWHTNVGKSEYNDSLHRCVSLFDGANVSIDTGRMTFYFFKWDYFSDNVDRTLGLNQTPTTAFGGDVSAGLESPADTATVTTDLPTLTTPTLSNLKNALDIHAEFRLNDAATFGGTPREGLFPPLSESVFTGQLSYTLDEDDALIQDDWYAQYRVVDTHGLAADWAPVSGGGGSAPDDYSSFTVSHPPTAAGMSPTQQKAVDFGSAGEVELDWSFTDGSPIDYQTAYEVEVERVTGAVSLIDTGKVVSETQRYTATIDPAEKANLLRWRARLWDRDDVVGSFTAWHEFYASDAPQVDVTAPVTTATTPKPTVTWNYTAGTHGAQTHYRVQIRKMNGEIVHDSKWIAGADTSYELPNPDLVLGEHYKIQVWVRDAVNFEVYDIESGVEASWSLTATPSSRVVDISNYESDGYVKVSWDNGSKDADFVEYQVYRKLTTGTEWAYGGRSAVGSGTENVTDFQAPANVESEWQVIQVREFDGIEVPSTYAGPVAATPVGDHYWLFDPLEQGVEESEYDYDTSASLKLWHSTAESFGEDYEETTIPLIGRGRKKEIGTRFGVAGVITVQLRGLGDDTAREERVKIENLRALREEMYLRNPFGDVWLVSLGKPQYDRTPGVGTREINTATIPSEGVT